MIILTAIIHDRVNVGERAITVPELLMAPTLPALLSKVKQHMNEAYEFEWTASEASINYFNEATDLQSMAAWFEHHYCSLELTYGSQSI